MTDDDKPFTRAVLKTELKAELAEVQSAMSEQMRHMEASLLGAFRNYALTGSDSAIEIRMAALENRVLELETRRRN